MVTRYVNSDATRSRPSTARHLRTIGDAVLNLAEPDEEELADIESVLVLSGCKLPGARRWAEDTVLRGIVDPRPESMRLERIAKMSLTDYGTFRRGERRSRGGVP